MIALGLTGFPLAHSLSPRIHQAALEYCNLKGSYSIFPLAPDDKRGMENLLKRVRQGEITGLNVTIPHKQAVMAWLDELTPTARAIGAVNTIFMHAGKLTGENTDAPGFMADLRSLLVQRVLDHKDALILGAGGAARAVTYALLNDGWSVVIAARRPGQAGALIAQFPQYNARMNRVDFNASALQEITADLSLVVNATPLGMSPDIERSPWPENLSLPPHAAVYDLVYNPQETLFVRNARSAGLPAANGLGMLIEQAALAFEIWTGCSVPREKLAVVEGV